MLKIGKQGGIERWGEHDSSLERYFSGKYNFLGLGGYDAQKLKDEVKGVQERGQKVLVLDLMGQGRPGIELGADAVIATSLVDHKEADQRIEQISGDALDPHTSEKLFARVQELQDGQDVRLHTTFFRPVWGLADSALNLHAFRSLYNDVRRLYGLTMDGGNIFLQTTRAGHDIRLLIEILAEFYPGSYENIVHSPHAAVALHIKKNSSLCAGFPTEEEVLRRIPSLERRLTDLDMLDKRRK